MWHSAKPGDKTVVVNYNDHNGANYSGTVVLHRRRRDVHRNSSATVWQGHGENYGDPIVVYNLKLADSGLPATW